MKSTHLTARLGRRRLGFAAGAGANGGNAGTATWTPYQQYSADFAADAANNGITLTPDFLKSLTDGARVTLTFRFWSGATVTYQVSRNGTTVTGVNA